MVRVRFAGLVAASAVLAAIGLAVVGPSSVFASSGYRDCSGITPAPGADMHRCDLPGVVYIGMDLAGINLARSNLLGADLGCDPDLPRTNLTRAVMYRVILTNGSLCDAVLVEADLHRSELSNVSFEDATLWDANLARATLDGALFNFTELRRADLSGVTMRGAFVNASFLHEVRLHGADLTGSIFGRSNLTGADVHQATLTNVDFTDANLTGADLTNTVGGDSVIWSNTTCPDGTNSDANGGTCLGHL